MGMSCYAICRLNEWPDANYDHPGTRHTADARTLIAELEAELEQFYPRESRHGYSVES